MPQIHPHINFNGNAEEAFGFYQSVFGGSFTRIIRFKDFASAEYPVADSEANKIMHIELPVGSSMLMANDVPEHMGRTNEQEHRSKIVVTADSGEEALRLFAGLSDGGQIEVPMDEEYDAPKFGMFRDRYGIEWMVRYDPSSN